MQTRILILFLFLASPLFARFYIGIEGGYIGNFGVFDIYQDNLKPLDLKKEKLNEGGIIGNIVLGTEHFFLNNYLGIRWGVFWGYGQTWGENQTYGKISTSTSLGGVNADISVNFIARENLTAGFFTGIEYGYIIPNPNQKIRYGEHFAFTISMPFPNRPAITVPLEEDCFVDNQISYGMPIFRFGTSFLLKKHHRIEFLAKLPLKTYKRTNSFLFEYHNNHLNSHQKYDTKVSYTHSSIQALLSYKYVF
ncbi:outer membrane protein [Helicobacter cholecystus]|uniref:outer membrane beta-barrel protein n=1 Tax=Helicobacter cholecystus TaxID=45498 RepID=UPI000CF17ECB|nr:outer membrane beta-barrel protein [Helicobacter cholecystus]VEJ24737.1 outer membrane protein [Helicobacter cholecystus]